MGGERENIRNMLDCKVSSPLIIGYHSKGADTDDDKRDGRAFRNTQGQ